MADKCIAFTAKGHRCRRRYTCDHGAGVRLCGSHHKVYSVLIQDGSRLRTATEMLEAIYHDEAVYVNRLLRREQRELRLQGEMFWLEQQEDERRLTQEIIEDAFDRRLTEIEQGIANWGRPERQVRPKKQISELEKFVNDKQNIHTNAAVKQTINILNTILKIPVSNDYKWNMEYCSRTPGEVIAACNLSIDSSRTMMDKYTSDDDIYDLGSGIYGRVLDCVWQYIKTSEDKETLCNILKTELEDNIGMCQQGNLSRLANVLAGYLEGVGSGESIAEVLGREFPKLWDINDEDERVQAGNTILDRLAVVDKNIRKAWIDGLY